MPFALAVLLTAHIFCVTLGYGGLIAAYAFLALQLRSHDPAVAGGAMRTGNRMSRTFGPLLGAGVLLGFAVMTAFRVPAAAPWLVYAYVLIAIALLLQALVGIPWNVRAMRALSQRDGLDGAVANVDARTPAVMAAALCATFLLLVLLMVWRPY